MTMPAKKKSLEDKLIYKKETAWKGLSKTNDKKVHDFAEKYKDFMNKGKTERLFLAETVKLAEKKGFKPIDKLKSYKPGTKVYSVNREKAICMAVLGKDSPVNGVNIVASHIDSPRLDLKQNPLYEDKETETALLRTHYYGGIKKYHWVTVPLSIHGVVMLGNGKKIEIAIGENEDDPVITIPDLLPHLSQAQAKRRVPDAIKAEELNVLIASRPLEDKDSKHKVKLWVMKYLNEKYGMVEEDFLAAELEIVPAGKARDVGLDRSMVGCYGQDDRISAYTSLMALCDMKTPKRTSMLVFFDKEEVGSESNTSVQSMFLMDFIGDLVALKEKNAGDRSVRKALSRSKALSSDVNAAVNPNFKSVHEMQNASKLGHGIVVTKFTGHRGKAGANDAHAEYVNQVRQVFNKAKIPWQIGELGKVDLGGGGTVAKFMARLNMDVVDSGPALLGMHSPFEVASKIDLWYTYKGYLAFYEGME